MENKIIIAKYLAGKLNDKINATCADLSSYDSFFENMNKSIDSSITDYKKLYNDKKDYLNTLLDEIQQDFLEIMHVIENDNQ